MKILINEKGKKLIYKYDKFYIRFMGGQFADTPCDVQISEKDANDIIESQKNILGVLNQYKKNIEWTMNHFLDTGIEDYLRYVVKLSDKKIILNLEKLNRNEDIKWELYETIMYEAFPVNSAITVEGYSAEYLNKETHLSVIGAYNYLIYLRDEPTSAMADLKAGLPRK